MNLIMTMIMMNPMIKLKLYWVEIIKLKWLKIKNSVLLVVLLKAE